MRKAITDPAGSKILKHIHSIEGGIFNRIKRIQLNFNQQREKFTVKQIVDLAKSPRMGKIHLILQDNKNNYHFVRQLVNSARFDVLFDQSGGNGKAIEEFCSPIHGVFYGYAGGINPSNIDTIISIMKRELDMFAVTYIDMETGIRTNDRFDLSKAEKILQATI